MIKLFRKVRQKLIRENKFNKWILYALGEVILVMIGILLALQVNKSNELRRLKIQEIDLLKGIKQDLLKDTVDIYYNIEAYKNFIKLDSVILSHIHNRNECDSKFLKYFHRAITSDWNITLHKSYFEELKVKGLSNISNLKLKNKISRFYQFDYPTFEKYENSYTNYDHRSLMTRNLEKHIEMDITGFKMKPQLYNRLLLDGHAIYTINKSRAMKKDLLEITNSILLENAKLRESIESEIKNLEN